MSAARSPSIDTPRSAYLAASLAVMPFLAGTVPRGIVTGSATYLNRVALFIVADRFQLPQGWQRALRFAPAAAPSAIAIPDLFLHQGQNRRCAG